MEEKVAIVTGAGGGIGSAIAVGLSEYGAKVVAADRSEQNAQTTCERIIGDGGEAIAVCVDVTDWSDIQNMVETAVRTFGGLDILVNSVGTNIRKMVVDMEEEDWDRVVDVNLKGVFLCCKAAGIEMVKQKRGKIINIASISSILGHTARCAYASSKGGEVQMSKVMAHEWAPYNVNVNVISPAAIDTPFIDGLKKSPEKLEYERKRIPLGRIGTPEDVVGAVVFLASEASNFITGANLLIDGGRIID